MQGISTSKHYSTQPFCIPRNCLPPPFTPPQKKNPPPYQTSCGCTLNSLPFLRTLRRFLSRFIGFRISIPVSTRPPPPPTHLRAKPTICILLNLAQPRRIVLHHAPIHRVAHPLVHADRNLVRHPHVQIDKIAAVDRVGDALELVHHGFGEPETPEVRRDRHGGDVAVPVFVFAFGLAEDYTSQSVSRPGRGGEMEIKMKKTPRKNTYCSP